ncbi:hypothetical protein [Leptodesmis sp.]|uniref:hypothetical protein n=1 Tax=Leptodesmis sp. TaxID=3100501 RepID=UPI00405350EA
MTYLLKKQWLSGLAILTIAALVYAVVLIINIPEEIYRFLTSPDSSILFLVLMSLLYFAYLPSGWLGTLTSYSATLILFASQLSAKWGSGLSTAGALAGLLPLGDGELYYGSALRLLNGETFEGVASWRPLSHGVLSSVLGLTQANLQLTIAILTLMTATGCFLFAREVQRSHGTVAGVFVLSILFLFARNYVGTVLTENWGLTLGTVGLAVLWRGLLTQRINLCLLGIGILSTALNTRAGLMLLLPAMVIWGTWAFRSRSSLSWRFLIGGLIAILLGFLINSLVFKVVAAPGAKLFGNFIYTLYGLVTGGNWMSIAIDHPNATDEDLYKLTFDAFRAHPWMLVSGFIRAWKQFLFEHYIFSSVSSLSINIVLQLLSLIALIYAFCQRQTPLGSFIIAATIGILLSLPFAPPWDDPSGRIYAATMPLFSLFPALGLAFLLQQISRPLKLQRQFRFLVQVVTPQEPSQLLCIFGVGLVLLTLFGPIAIKLSSHPPQFAEITCPSGSEVVYFRNSRGSSVMLVADNAVKRTYVPRIRISDFKADMSQSKLTAYQELNHLDQNTNLIFALNLKNLPDDQGVWIIAPSSLIPKDNGIIAACGKSKPQGVKTGLWMPLFYADSMTLVSR